VLRATIKGATDLVTNFPTNTKMQEKEAHLTQRNASLRNANVFLALTTAIALSVALWCLYVLSSTMLKIASPPRGDS